MSDAELLALWTDAGDDAAHFILLLRVRHGIAGMKAKIYLERAKRAAGVPFDATYADREPRP